MGVNTAQHFMNQATFHSTFPISVQGIYNNRKRSVKCLDLHPNFQFQKTFERDNSFPQYFLSWLLLKSLYPFKLRSWHLFWSSGHSKKLYHFKSRKLFLLKRANVGRELGGGGW